MIEFYDADSEYMKTSLHLENFMALVFLDSNTACPVCLKSSLELSCYLTSTSVLYIKTTRTILSTILYPSGDSEVH